MHSFNLKELNILFYVDLNQKIFIKEAFQLRQSQKLPCCPQPIYEIKNILIFSNDLK